MNFPDYMDRITDHLEILIGAVVVSNFLLVCLIGMVAYRYKTKK